MSEVVNERIIVPIVGEAGSGKTGLCARLAREHDFSVVSVSGIIRDFAETKGRELGSRSDYWEVHKQMKDELGPDIVAETILDNLPGRLCVDGLRVVKDAERLQRAPGVSLTMVALWSKPVLRFNRIQHRKSGLEGLTYEEFLKNDQRDAYNTDEELQNTLAVMKRADHHIDASQEEDVVFKAVEEIVLPLLPD